MKEQKAETISNALEKTTPAKIGRPKGSKDGHPRASRTDMAWSGNDNLKAGDNRKYLRHALVSANLPEIDIADADQVEERVNWYFNQCLEDDMKPTVSGLCNALGIARRTLYGWGVGEYRRESHTAVIERAKRVLEEMWEDYAINGKVNPVIAIFLGKNHFGYQDKNEFVLTPNNDQIGEEKTPEELQQKYVEYVVTPDDEEGE